MSAPHNLIVRLFGWNGKKQRSRLKEMMQLRKSAIGEEIHVFNKMIAAELALYYEQLDSPQQALPLQKAI